MPSIVSDLSKVEVGIRNSAASLVMAKTANSQVVNKMFFSTQLFIISIIIFNTAMGAAFHEPDTLCYHGQHHAHGPQLRHLHYNQYRTAAAVQMLQTL